MFTVSLSFEYSSFFSDLNLETPFSPIIKSETEFKAKPNEWPTTEVHIQHQK